jgi:hypothetical protein
MKAATAGNRPEPLVVPRTVVGVQICRLSGKRPAGGCDAVPVLLDSGEEEERSMIGTEYFVRGTVPDETCPLHVGRSLFSRLTGWMGGPRSEATEHRAGTPNVPPPPAEAAPEEPTERDAPVVEKESEPKKRGFWGRIFGRRDKDAEKKKDPDPKPRR